MSHSCSSGSSAFNLAAKGSADIARSWAESLLCFFLPVCNCIFLATGPHAWDAALMWTLPVWLCILADYFSPSDRAPGKSSKPNALERLLDARLYVLFGLQVANILLLLKVAGELRWGTSAEFAFSVANIVAMRIMAGTASCCSGIAVAHELIHRRAKYCRWMGRALLWTVCYDHFAVEHGRGHHRRAATLHDPATARFGETFSDFFGRSVRGQWISAWRLERQRLEGRTVPNAVESRSRSASRCRRIRAESTAAKGCRPATWWHELLNSTALRKGPGRLARNRILQGIGLEIVLLGLILGHFGPVALSMFLYQAWVAVRMLEAVNYVQHWGLIRSNSRFGAADAWSTDSWFTVHTFIGLARHADHHARAAKSHHWLSALDESPRLPYGYFVTVFLVRLANARYIELASRELEARGLGPFRSAFGEGPAGAAASA